MNRVELVFKHKKRMLKDLKRILEIEKRLKTENNPLSNAALVGIHEVKEGMQRNFRRYCRNHGIEG